MPIVGALRFVYRLGTNEVATEVAARMCQECGHVDLPGPRPGGHRAGPSRRATRGRTRPRSDRGAPPVPHRTGGPSEQPAISVLMLFVVSLTALGGLAQHKYYARTVRRLAAAHNARTACW